MARGTRATATRGTMVDETRAKLRGVKDASMKRAKPAIERARTTTKRAVEMVKTLDVGARARRALGADARVAIGYCVVGMLAAAATARGVVGGSAKMNALAAALARCVVETKIGAHRGLAFVDRYFVVLVKHLSERAGALRTTSPNEAKAKAMLDVIIAFASSGAAAMHVKMILITIAFSAIARVVFDRSTRRREVKVVLVTGGSGGLGSLLLEGIRTEFPNAIVYGTSRAGASSKKLGRQSSGFFGIGTPSKEEIAKKNDPSVPLGAELDNEENVVSHPLLTMDLTKEDSIAQCIASIVERHGKIDVLINNAGVCLCSWAKQTPRDDAEMIMQTNFLGAVSVIRHAMPHLSQGANIINVGSIAGRIGIPFQSMYSASKAALMVYTDALRMETKGSGVRVSLIEPGDLRLQKGAASVVKSSGFESDPVADRAEKIMRAEEAAGTNPIKVVKAVVSAIKSSAPKNRYYIGPDAWLVEALSRACSYSAREYFLASHYRVPPRDRAWIRV